MSIEERYKCKNCELQERIQKEIEDVQNGISTKNAEQLYGMLEELRNIFNVKGKPLSFPRYVVDSWDYSDKLGKELLDLSELYKKWK